MRVLKFIGYFILIILTFLYNGSLHIEDGHVWLAKPWTASITLLVSVVVAWLIKWLGKELFLLVVAWIGVFIIFISIHFHRFGQKLIDYAAVAGGVKRNRNEAN